MRLASDEPGHFSPPGPFAVDFDSSPSQADLAPEHRGGNMNLTFATWNILSGGIDAGDDARLRRQMALLVELQPSVIAIQECKHWDQGDFRALRLAERMLAMRGFLAPSSHHGCHLAVFIRDDAGLRVVEERHEYGDPWWHGVACVLVEVEGIQWPLQLASCHLAPSSPTRRLEEAESFALVVERGALIAGGDWNALPAADPEPSGPVSGNHRWKLDRRTAEALQDLGLLDIGAHMQSTTPTVGHAGGLAYRCDRIYTTLPASTITGYRVITTADDESDHRPVVAEFDLTSAATLVGGGCR
jgi:endonuclease/exonuclease/phosphatase family metal-dependent hydrolase